VDNLCCCLPSRTSVCCVLFSTLSNKVNPAPSQMSHSEQKPLSKKPKGLYLATHYMLNDCNVSPHADGAFRQQKLKSWQFIISPFRAVVIFFVIGKQCFLLVHLRDDCYLVGWYRNCIRPNWNVFDQLLKQSVRAHDCI
jgi:hypothetical protein